jgi:phosphoglycolate phosphatase
MHDEVGEGGMDGSIDTVIFDLDGTLADTLRDIADAMNDVLMAAGMPDHPYSTYPGFVGGGVKVLVERATPSDQQHRLDELREAFRERYFAQLILHTQAYAGIERLLDELTSRSITLAVLSNKPDAATRHIVRELFGSSRFASVHGQRDGIPKKPDPSAVLDMAQELGSAPARCAFVGDTAIDMTTATRAEMLPVGVLWGFRDRDELIGAGARHLLDEPADLLRLLS